MKMESAIPIVRNVAVIGAGLSGLVAAKYLSDAGLAVTVFERGGSLGGIWLYDDRRPSESRYPNCAPSTAETVPLELDRTADTSKYTDEQSIATLQLQHAPPSPAYRSLKNNIPTCLMSFKDHDWPEGTLDYTDHTAVLIYIKSFARKHNIDRLINFNTRVCRVAQQDTHRWLVETCTLRVDADQVHFKTQSHLFDAVIVCSGHHSAPKIPDIKGLAELKQVWPRRIMHSKSYRRPEDILGQNVVLLGNGASAFDIAHEIKGQINKLYQVTKVNSGYIPIEFMPPIVERVAEIAYFEITSPEPEPNNTNPDFAHPLPVRIHLIDGTVLDNIHSIVLCTGYLRSYPFLPQYHHDHTTPAAADATVLVTDGSMLHNLHRDIFYLPSPTLSFVGVPTGTTSLALFEFQAMAIAAVYTAHIPLPSQHAMRAAYRERVVRKGVGRRFHLLQDEEIAYVQEIVDWVNAGRDRDRNPITGLSEGWLAKYEERKVWLGEIFKKKREGGGKGEELSGEIPSVCASESSNYFA